MSAPKKSPKKPGRSCVVGGHVRCAGGAGAAGMFVEIVGREVGKNVRLGGAISASDGSYQASITTSSKQPPDVQARAWTSKGKGGTLLGESDVRFDVTGDVVLDIDLPTGASGLASEYEVLTEALAAFCSGRLAELEESDERRDVSYLANKTAWDARAVAMAALADEFAEHRPQEIPGALYYALFRAGLPADPESLYRVQRPTVEQVWRDAIEQGVVPARLEAELPRVLNVFEELAIDHELKARPPSGGSTLEELLEPALPGDAQGQRKFARLHRGEHGGTDGFWGEVEAEFGRATARRLRLHAQLARLTLNNGPLIQALLADEDAGLEEAPHSGPVQLARSGYFRPERWKVIIGGAAPDGFPGATDEERRDRYAELLAAKVRLSSPTAAIAAQVETGDLLADADKTTRKTVHAFLNRNLGSFEVGSEPVETYLARNQDAEHPGDRAVDEIKRLQRVYQMTPHDRAMKALLDSGLHSAMQIAQQDERRFVADMSADLGEAGAKAIHARARQIHNAVVNMATGLLTARAAPTLGSAADAPILAPSSVFAAAAPGPGIGDFPTLEGLLGALDYPACEDCQSVLSPAAYLVDLLTFIDRPQPSGGVNPQEVFLGRRPDVQHLPLTCENTTAALPYIDLVNETLEYFVVHGQSLNDYTGHDTGEDVQPQELLARPQFVNNAAYDTLAAEFFPAPLPFDLPLETLRRLFAESGVPLVRAMTLLRRDEQLVAHDASGYGWRDILMERLGFSRAEHRLLTDHAVSLQQLSGVAATTSEADVVASLSGVKSLARGLGLTYVDVVALLRVRFVNPSSAILPMVERLKVPLATLTQLKHSRITKAAFKALLPADLDATDYGGDVAEWVTRDENYSLIRNLIVLSEAAGDGVPFDQLRLTYLDRAGGNALQGVDFIRLIRFVRLWRKLRWSIEETDSALAAFLPPGSLGDGPDNETRRAKLDAGCLAMLDRLAIAMWTMDRLGLEAGTNLAGLLACWAPIDTYGAGSLYRTLFVAAGSQRDAAFGDNGLREASGDMLLVHAGALRAAFRLTDSELGAILADRGFTDQTPLTLANVSDIHRRGWLARALGVSVAELVALVRVSGIDPFEMPEPPAPAVWRLLDLLDGLRAAGLAPADALNLLWSVDVRGGAPPDDRLVPDVARALRSALTAIETELSGDGSGEERTHELLAAAFGAEAADFMFGLLGGSLSVGVEYSQSDGALGQAMAEASHGRIAYDAIGKRLSYAGFMTEDMRRALKAAQGGDDFAKAIEGLFNESKARAEADPVFAASDGTIEQFLADHPQPAQLLAAHAASADPPEAKRAALLAAILPALRDERERQEALTTAARAAATAVPFAQAVLADATVLHSASDAAKPALDDLVALRLGGLDPAPPGPTRHWSGSLEVLETGSYDLRVNAGANAAVTLSIDGDDVELVATGSATATKAPKVLDAGALHQIALGVRGAGTAGSAGIPPLSWRLAGREWQDVPARCLYATTVLDHLVTTFTRFLKVSRLAAALNLTAGELAYLARRTELEVADQGWLNMLPTEPPPAASEPSASPELASVLEVALDLARLKAALSPDDERLLAVLQGLSGAAPAAGTALLAVTGWEQGTLDALVARFGLADVADLADPTVIARLFDAYEIVSTLGISAPDLFQGTTINPDISALLAIERALQARLGQDAWLTVQGSVNEPLRRIRRDALVAYILRQLGRVSATQHIDTPDKLFEFFLMDVQMEPCTQTSRVRHALSAVQLFIERVLMNLEPKVSPDVLDRGRWEWMKRYRLWEANREVFLWPENWLEPELREDQSSFYARTLSELLQSDITEETAASALLGYLSSLEEVAKLEPCSIHYVEGPNGVLDGTAHVIGRTAGAQRKYYYRRMAFDAWTPWEPITLDIEDNPITPVVWNGRLLLFWLKILPGVPVPVVEQAADQISLAEVPYPQVKSEGATKLRLTPQAALCWSEYYNGRWQAPKTSNINAPTGFGHDFDIAGQGAFDRGQLVLGQTLEADAMRVRVWGQPRGLNQSGGTSFKFFNTHSLPVRQEDEANPLGIDNGASLIRGLDSFAATFEIEYTSQEAQAPLVRQILTKTDGGPYGTVSPFNFSYGTGSLQQSLIQDVWETPFFFEDSRHAFYVVTGRLDDGVHDAAFGVVPPRPNARPLPPLTTRSDDGVSDRVILRDGRPSVHGHPSRVPLALEPGNIGTFIDSTSHTQFRGREIAPHGLRSDGASRSG